MEYSKILNLRKALFPKNLLMTYTKPVRFIKGEMQYLTSDEGYKYLDAYNNVPHVGHCHPRIAEVAYKQLSTLNTNTRYLHENMVNLGERLISMFPEKLKICTFVNSGSEANDLALRMARIHTQRRGILCMEYAYHGTLSSLLPISEYKYRKDPTYKEDNCYIASLPYTYQHPQRTNSYLLSEVQNLISSMNKNNHKIGAYIHESFPSCGG
jgi:4-aminobutyrate aminotransferase-like enzyme